MKSVFKRHTVSLLFVLLVFLLVYIFIVPETSEQENKRLQQLKVLSGLDGIDYEKPLHRAIFKDVCRHYGNTDPDFLLKQIDLYRTEQFSKLQDESTIDINLLQRLFFMSGKFLLVFIIVMILTYYGVETLAVLRFINYCRAKKPLVRRLYLELKNFSGKKDIHNTIRILSKSAGLFIFILLKSITYLILFSPAYVIAYSFKTKFDTDSIGFMVLLGLISNGMLIHYTQRFYTCLINESRKGYVQTAIVKNLVSDYNFNTISIQKILSFSKSFTGHILSHIFKNAQYQYIATIKEQAAFLITGLIIIEMALNIHGHLFYELLRQLLYQNYGFVLITFLIVFIVVKATEMAVDYWQLKMNIKYDNE